VSQLFAFSEYLLDGEPDAAGRQVDQLLWGYFLTPVTMAIVNLGIPAVLADKALTAQEVATAAGTAPEATARLLAAGMAVGLLAADAHGRFTLTDMGRWLRPDVSSVSDLTGFWQAPTLTALYGLADQVRSGDQVDPAAPGGIYDYLSSRPEQAARFFRAMGYVTSRMLAALTAADYRPPAGQRIVDVGGSRGTLLAWLLKAVPGAAGVLFDRPESLAGAPDYLASAGVTDRVELVAGNFLAEVPEGDLHVLSQVLHNWDDERVAQIARNCRRSARPGASLIVIEPVLPPVPEPAVGHLMDILMMTLLGGRERTRDQHQALIEPAGYTLARGVPLHAGRGAQPPWQILEFRRD
jgi:predicted O-methyltransferase YrrM